MKVITIQIARLLLIWIGALFLAPGLGIHLHHEVNEFGIQSIIHSYFLEDHSDDHPPVDSPPECLHEHLTSTGISVDLKSWDSSLLGIGFINTLWNMSCFLLAFILLVVIWIGFRNIQYFISCLKILPKNPDGFGLLSPYRIQFSTYHYSLRFNFYLPPPFSKL